MTEQSVPNFACAICTEDADKDYMPLECSDKHRSHSKCILEWWKKESQDCKYLTCPTCSRVEISMPLKTEMTFHVAAAIGIAFAAEDRLHHKLIQKTVLYGFFTFVVSAITLMLVLCGMVVFYISGSS